MPGSIMAHIAIYPPINTLIPPVAICIGGSFATINPKIVPSISAFIVVKLQVVIFFLSSTSDDLFTFVKIPKTLKNL